MKTAFEGKVVKKTVDGHVVCLSTKSTTLTLRQKPGRGRGRSVNTNSVLKRLVGKTIRVKGVRAGKTFTVSSYETVEG